MMEKTLDNECNEKYFQWYKCYVMKHKYKNMMGIPEDKIMNNIEKY
jgi:hypothetical protein